MSSLDWGKANRREARYAAGRTAREAKDLYQYHEPKPPTPKQLRYIEHLSKELGVDEPPIVETKFGATATIKALKRRIESKERGIG